MFRAVARRQTRTMITSNIVVYAEHGEPKDVLRTHTYQIDETKLGGLEVVVKTLGAPINPSDINQIQGVYPLKPPMTKDYGTDVPVAPCGNEGLFEVIHTGANTELKVGDWVVPANVNFGTWRTHAKDDESKFQKINNPTQSKAAGKPHGLTINQAATISVNPPTALLMLTHYVKLEPGKDWFIQNGGNSAVGQYASQIGKILGFNSISVVRDRPNLAELKKELEEVKGATHVITDEQNNSRDFTGTVKQWTKESGGQIKLGLNCVGGKLSAAVARKLAPNGLMLTYGGMSMQPVTIPTSLHIFKNITSAGFWVTELLKNDRALKQKTLNQIVEWYEQGKLIDAPSNHIKFSEGDDLAKLYIDGVADKLGKQMVVY